MGSEGSLLVATGSVCHGQIAKIAAVRQTMAWCQTWRLVPETSKGGVVDVALTWHRLKNPCQAIERSHGERLGF